MELTVVRAREIVGSTQARYVVTGVWNAVFGLLAFTSLWLLLQDYLAYGLVLLIAQVVAVVQAHWAQRRFTWGARGAYLPELGRFSVVYSVVFVANLGLLAVAVEVIGLPVMLSQMVIGMGLVVGSYTVNRVWTFRHGRSVSHEGTADAGKATTIRAGQAPGDQGSGR